MCRNPAIKSNVPPPAMTTAASSAMTLPGAPGATANMRKMLRNLAALLLLGTAAALPVPALAHAVVVKAQPALDQEVAAGPLDIRLEFNSRIDKERSRLQLTAPDGTRSDVPIAEGGEPTVLMAQVPALPPGAYTLRWQVLAVDGHITRGDIPFTVGE